jgi:thiamine biosynthesis lipoprotein
VAGGRVGLYDAGVKLRRLMTTLLVLMAVSLAAALAWKLLPRTRREVLRPVGVMGTETRLVAVGPDRPALRSALRSAEAALRRVEVMMSEKLDRSQLLAVNSDRTGRPVEVAPELLGLLRASRELTEATGGAFDPTCRPILRTWAAAARAGEFPPDRALAEALAATGWEHFELTGDPPTVARLHPGASIDLGGIAKGRGIDRAVEALRRGGATGGLVDVGGDIRCFGRSERGRPWRVTLQDPFASAGRAVLLLELTDRAVATSGDYRRYSTIARRRISHIVDPRTGRPVEGASSVTVLAPDATTADAWATGLSVLGPDGIPLAERAGLEVLMITGPPERAAVHFSEGFARHVAAGWPPRVTPTGRRDRPAAKMTRTRPSARASH